MPDRLTLTTEEGCVLEASEAALREVAADLYRPALGGMLLPDGVKGVFWDDPFLVAVHQMPPLYRPTTWIAADSPEDFGPETKYRKAYLSFPYSLVFASFVRMRGSLQLTEHNELYFSNRPIRCEDDHVCYPGLLNVSYIDAGDRIRSWICTQHLDRSRARDWCGQLQALLDHTWNGAFNRSSEYHEGRSMYQFSEGIHPELHPVEQWERASRANPRFGLEVPWRPMPLSVGELARRMLAELAQEGKLGAIGPRARRLGLIPRLARRLHKKIVSQNGEDA